MFSQSAAIEKEEESTTPSPIDETTENEYNDDDENYLEMYLSDKQLKTLRKEVDRRRKNKTLDTFYLSKDDEYMSYNENDDEDDDDDDEGEYMRMVSEKMVSDIANTLRREEVVVVRAISRDNVKMISTDANTLVTQLEAVLGQFVVLVKVKGYTASYYCPMIDQNDIDAATQDYQQGKRRNQVIKLWTNYKPNKWKRKPKALRNERGSIMKDENGNIIRE